MCALTPMFQSKQEESTMEYYPWLSQVDSFSPTLHLPSFLYPLDDSVISKCGLVYPTSKSSGPREKVVTDSKMSLSHSNGTNSNINGLEAEEEEDGGRVLEKKLCHNASERDRRRKLNDLYSSLRSLLPLSDQKRKLSIPVTVSRVVKYIPEQRQELQQLSRRKEELVKRITRRTMTLKNQQDQLRNKTIMDSIESMSQQQVAATWLSDTEIAVQIATSSWTSISDMLLRLEENMIKIISISSSVSSTVRIFYTLHLQIRGDYKLRLEELNSMLFGLHQSY